MMTRGFLDCGHGGQRSCSEGAWRRRGAKISAALVLGLAIAHPAAFAQDALPETIRLGGLAPATGTGSVIGVAIDTGVSMAVNEINAAGGIAGRQIELIMGDTQSDPTTSSNEAKRLVYQENVNLLIGPAVSQEVFPAAIVATEAKVVQLTTAGTLELTVDVAPYHFAFQWSADAQAVAMVDYALDLGNSKSPGILADNGGQSKSGVAGLHRRLEERGVKAAGEQEFTYRVDDMTPQLLSLRRQGADSILFFASSVEDTGLLLTTLDDLGWDVPVIGQGSVSESAPIIAEKYGSEVLGNVVGEAYPGMTYCSSDPVGSSEYAGFLRRLNDYRPDVVGKVPSSTIAHFYAMVYILKTAVEATSSVDGPTIATWIEGNASSIPVIHGTPKLAEGSHFLFDPSSIVMVRDPHIRREDGLLKRAGC